MPVIITSADFESKVIKSELPVLLVFSATWCMPCRQLAPVIEALSLQYEGKVNTFKVDVDQSSDLASQYGVSTIPQVFVLKDGNVVETISGSRNKAEYEKYLNKYI